MVVSSSVATMDLTLRVIAFAPRLISSVFLVSDRLEALKYRINNLYYLLLVIVAVLVLLIVAFSFIGFTIILFLYTELICLRSTKYVIFIDSIFCSLPFLHLPSFFHHLLVFVIISIFLLVICSIVYFVCSTHAYLKTVSQQLNNLSSFSMLRQFSCIFIVNSTPKIQIVEKNIISNIHTTQKHYTYLQLFYLSLFCDILLYLYFFIPFKLCNMFYKLLYMQLQYVSVLYDIYNITFLEAMFICLYVYFSSQSFISIYCCFLRAQQTDVHYSFLQTSTGVTLVFYDDA